MMSERRGRFSWEQEVVESELPSTTRLLLLAIAVRMNKLGEGCFPSTEQLCAMTGLSKKAVITHRQNAIDAGWLLTSEMGFRGRKWRRFSYVAAVPGTTTCGVLLDDGHTDEGGQNVDEVVNEVHHHEERGGERGTPKVVNEVHHVYDQTNNQTTLERERAEARTQDEKGGQTESTEPVPQNLGPDFDSGFWRKWFNRGIDSKTKARAAYDRLSADEKRAAIAGIKPYKANMDAAGRKKIPAAMTYLAEKKWEDQDSEPDAGGKYMPPVAAPYSPLWMASLFERLLTGCDGRSISFDLSRAASGHGVGLRFGKARDDELAALSQEFERAQLSSPKGQAWRRWLEGRLIALRIAHAMPRWPDKFWLFVPSPAIARAWGITLDLPSANAHPPPDPISEQDAAEAFK